MSSTHRRPPLAVALRRAYGAALYLESTYPGVSDRVEALSDAVPADAAWTTRRWMEFSIIVRRTCRGLPFSAADAHADHALWTLRRQLAHALLSAHAALVAEQRPRRAPGSAPSDGALPDFE